MTEQMTERKKIMLLLAIGVGIVAAMLFVISRNSPLSFPQSSNSPAPASFATANATGKRQSDDGAGNVTIAASWSKQDDVLRFAVDIDTHSEDLSGFDPMRQIILEDAQGAATPPTTIIPEGEGHHRSYTIDFPSRDGEIRLVVKNLSGVAKRELVWPQ